MDLDSDLRTTMARRADAAPSPDGLLGIVLERGRRAHRRRVLSGVAAAVVVLLFGGIGITAIVRPDETRTLRISDGTRETAPPAPISVGWFPAGLGKPRVLYQGPETWSVDAGRLDAVQTVSVWVTPVAPTRLSPVTTIDVGGTPATIYWAPTKTYPDRFAELTYQRKPGQWIEVVADRAARPRVPVSQNDLVRVAESITDQPQPVEDVVRMATPAGAKIGWVIADDAGSYVGYVDAGPPPVGGPRERLSVGVLSKDSITLSTLPSEADPGSDGSEPLKPLDIPAGGRYFATPTPRFAYRVPGHPEAVLLLSVSTSSDPLASEGALRALAETARLGPDAVLAR
ncbi:hypothetical protein [Cryptosporangium sp. NPDC051539]|uniref:hypothetical protein n=1 Tax=Cryptosporangium sp. NPDC051539 TaxID=3363962 RepID=UPI0037AB8E7A